MAERQRGEAQALPSGMAPQECIVLADMMQLELGQKTTDVIDQLTNNDFEGDFFKLGDTVQVVSIDPNSIKVVEGDKNDIRPKLDRIAFSANTMVIDRKREFAFQIRDLERLEDRWNHESAAHALAARKMRDADCLDVLNLITDTDESGIAFIGSLTNPIDLTTTGVGGNNVIETEMAKGNKVYRLVNAMKEYLRQKGIIDGEQYKFGANKTVQLRGTASLFVSPDVHNTLLNAQYVRVDDVTENVIRDGKYEKFAGLLLNCATSLDKNYPLHVNVLDRTDITVNATGIIILGTKNLVTRAGKVLPPEKMRDYVHFADNYYGREIYGRMIACPEAAIIAFVKTDSEFLVQGNGFTPVDNTKGQLFKQYPEENPVRPNGYPEIPVTDVPPYTAVAGTPDNGTRNLANLGYMNEEIKTGTYVTPGDLNDTLGSYATNDALTAGLNGKASSTHVHKFDVTGEAQTDVETDGPTEPAEETPGE